MSVGEKLQTAELIHKAASNAAALKEAKSPSAADVWKRSPEGFGSLESLAAATGASAPGLAQAQQARAAASQAAAAYDDPAEQAEAMAREKAEQEALKALGAVVLDALRPGAAKPGVGSPGAPQPASPKPAQPSATTSGATSQQATTPPQPASPAPAPAGQAEPPPAEQAAPGDPAREAEATTAKAAPRQGSRGAGAAAAPPPTREVAIAQPGLVQPGLAPLQPAGKYSGIVALAAEVGVLALAKVGAVFQAATDLEKLLSGPFVAIPFPCFPALRVGDTDLGFPHGHSHPPNLVPPAPLIPLPSMGPVIKIPFLSGADKTLTNGQPAACCGDMGLGVFCGGFVPMFEVKFGSASVWIEGARAARCLVDITNHCIFRNAPGPKDPPIGAFLGTTSSGSPNVLIGGVPMPSLMELGFGLAFKALGKAMKGLKKGAKFLAATKAGKAAGAALGKVRDALGRLGARAGKAFKDSICFFSGHPVNVADGSVLAFAEDFALPGQLPLQWKRDWYSSSERDGLLGHGWHHPYDLALAIDKGAHVSAGKPEDIVGLRLANGGHVIFPPLDGKGEAFDRTERMTLFRDERGYGVRTAEHLTYRFAPSVVPDGASHELASVEDPSGARITFCRNETGHLRNIVDSAGRMLRVETDAKGHITSIAGPDPQREGRWLPLVRYEYDDAGNLTEVRDALGQRQRYRYADHLLQQETDRNGLSFYFEYRGSGVDARCTRTWGDGGLYDHRMEYAEGSTRVTNSLGEVSHYFMNGAGLVTKQEDPCGGVTQYEYNEFNQELSQTDPLGRATASVFDERGNLIEATTTDGTRVTLEYDSRDDLVSAVDAMGGVWAWAYDDQHRLTSRTDPTGTTTRYEYRGRYLGALVDAAGRRTHFAYDAYGNLAKVTLPDGTTTEWEVDPLGRPTSVTDALGNVQHLSYDVMGRVHEVREPDGNRRTFGYDAEGNVVHAKDRQRDVRFRYHGMGRMVERSEAGVTVKFEYDTEEQLRAIHNQHGRVYQFELDGAGEVVTESGFDGVRRVYERDLAGQVTKLVRASGLESVYRYDDAGRVLSIEHSDESKESYEYRADGALLVADNGAVSGPVRFERDSLGRIAKEWQGDHWVASDYDVLGLRSRMRSSLGALQDIERDLMGDVRRVAYREVEPGEAAGGDAGAGAEAPAAKPKSVEALWEARFERDRLGLELQRSLPGGVQSRWKRDKLGRPIQHQVVQGVGAGGVGAGGGAAGGAPSRDVKYTWDVNGRLRQMLDAHKGLTRFEHDAVGNLAAVHYADGTADLRLPDAVGNLFRSRDKQDRKYGPAGQLLERRSDAGVTRYEYDAEGNLVVKRDPRGGVWEYRWNAAGMLSEVVRPDGEKVAFVYDALGRRTQKRFAGKVTRWVWDGNNPLHEWVTRGGVDAGQGVGGAPAAPNAPTPLEGALLAHPPTGPPEGAESAVAVWSDAGSDAGSDAPGAGSVPPGGPPEGLTTWLFEPESFAPLAKIVGGQRQSIVCDHLGTPVAMYDAKGARVWAAELGGYGGVRSVDAGARGDCPFRYPGQYEDAETGLYYNRFRYYDPEAGTYVSQDPIGLAGGAALYGYVGDPTGWVDPFGLAKAAAHNPGKAARAGTKRFTPEQQALVDMAKRDKQVGGITKGDMKAYKDLNAEAGAKGFTDKGAVRGPEAHPLRSPNSKPGPGQKPHGHVGPVNHIPIKDAP